MKTSPNVPSWQERRAAACEAHKIRMVVLEEKRKYERDQWDRVVRTESLRLRQERQEIGRYALAGMVLTYTSTAILELLTLPDGREYISERIMRDHVIVGSSQYPNNEYAAKRRLQLESEYK